MVSKVPPVSQRTNEAPDRNNHQAATPCFGGTDAFEQHGSVGEDMMGSIGVIIEDIDTDHFAMQQDAELFSGMDFSLDWYGASFDYGSCS